LIPVLPSVRTGRSAGALRETDDVLPFSVPGIRAAPEMPIRLVLRNSRRLLFFMALDFNYEKK
jgi:hypothetical protein